MQSDTCYGNNTVFNENDIDNNAGSRVTCFRRGSTSTDNVLFNNEGEDVSCDSGAVQCVIGSGFITIVTPSNFGGMRNGMYTCTIDGLSINTRIYIQSDYNNLFDSGELHEFYSITSFYCSFIN